MERTKQLKQIKDFVDLASSAAEQFDDELIDQDEFVKRIEKYIADYRAGKKIGMYSLEMPFGEYKGEMIDELPTTYLFWLKDQEWFEWKFKSHHDAMMGTLRSRGEID